MEAADLVTVTEAAKRLGVNKSTVSRQVERLRVPKDGQQRFSFSAFSAARNGGLNTLMMRNREAPPEDGEAASEEVPPVQAQFRQSGLSTAATAHKALQAKQLEISIRRDLGELVDAADVARDEQTVWADLTAALLALPARLAPELARMDDAAAVRHRLDREIKAAFADAAAKLKSLPDVPDDFGDVRAA